jgi:hypothetical protein
MKRILPLAVLALTVSTAFAEEDKVEIAKPSFSVFHEFGSISHGTDYENLEFNDYFLQRSGVWMTLKAVRNDRLTLNATLGGVYWNPTYNENSNSESFLRYFAAAAPRASATYVFGDLEKPAATVEVGMFPYKYNDNTHNLGEYMFRSTAYPTQVFTGGLTWVDVNRAQVTGLRASQAIGDWFSHDALLTFETDQLPYYDLNLSYLAKAKLGKALKLTGGIQFARILPNKSKITDPDVINNHYFSFNDTTYIDNSDYYQQRLKDKPGSDSLQYVRGNNLATQLTNLVNNGMTMREALDSLEAAYAVTGSSYDNYNMQSTKIVASFAFDPKALIGDAGGLLGPNDLILYGEAALLGVKNYPILYENRLERTVGMLGLNLPTFRQLEVLAVEVEWFGSRQPNSSAISQQTIGKNADGDLQPLPQPSIYSGNLFSGYNPDDWKKDDIHWSVFGRRQLVKGFNLDVQVASDNARGFVYPSGRRYWSYFRSPSDWYWMMKLTASL